MFYAKPIDINNTYWKGNGKYQQFFNEELNNENINDLPIKKGLKDKFKSLVHAYYGFYNNGDHPKHKVFKESRWNSDIFDTLESEVNKIIKQIQEAIQK